MLSDPQYPEIVLRGLIKMLPGLSAYLGKTPRPRVDGGYYTKTKDNRPIIGKLPLEGSYVLGALSGFGMMAACAAGELLAAYIVNDQLPNFAPAFSMERFSDPNYLKLLESWEVTWQL
jgi:glycine/D-amino acid oxidase-like deaminating enzyme